MSYCISNMIGIRTGGVFSGKTDMDDLRARLRSIVKEMAGGEHSPDICADDLRCVSDELEAHKGTYVVIAGVFNYWGWDAVSDFASRLSAEFGVEVMLMSWDEERDKVRCQVFLAGRPLFEVSEDPVGRTLRRVV